MSNHSFLITARVSTVIDAPNEEEATRIFTELMDWTKVLNVEAEDQGKSAEVEEAP